MAQAVLDTGVWVEGASGFAPTLGRRTLVATPLVVAELVSLAERGKVPRELVGHVLGAARLEEVTLEDAMEGGRLHGLLRTDGSKASLVDCITYATARRLRAAFVTRDHDLRGRPGVAVLS